VRRCVVVALAVPIVVAPVFRAAAARLAAVDVDSRALTVVRLVEDTSDDFDDDTSDDFDDDTSDDFDDDTSDAASADFVVVDETSDEAAGDSFVVGAPVFAGALSAAFTGWLSPSFAVVSAGLAVGAAAFDVSAVFVVVCDSEDFACAESR
jgi:hypothetical protein